MLTKAGNRTYEGIYAPEMRPRLNAMERGILKWAVIDRDDRVLDIGLGNGMMVDYLRRNMECEVCGVSDNMELVRSTRALVCSADLVYAPVGDIPWRDGAFQTVLMRLKRMDADMLRLQLEEVSRVMKDGGQLVVGIECLPRVIGTVKRLLGDSMSQEPEAISRKKAEAMLAELGFEHFSWQRIALECGVLICWKKNPLEEDCKRFTEEKETASA